MRAPRVNLHLCLPMLVIGLLVAVAGTAYADETTPKSPNERIKFACIGVGGKGRGDTEQAGRHGRIVAVCAVVALAARNGEALRRDLMQAKRDGKLPLPPEVTLELALVNTGKGPVEVRLGDAAAELSLELPGEGVIRIEAPPEAKQPDFLRPQTLLLDAGKTHVIHIDRLIAGSPGKLDYIYFTEPGEYTLTARFRLTADGRIVTVTGEKVRIKVGNQE